MLKRIFISIAITVMVTYGFSGCIFNETFKVVFQVYDGCKSYELRKNASGSNGEYVTGYMIEDTNGKVLLKSDYLIYIADDGNFVEVKYTRDEYGAPVYAGSTIIKTGIEDVFVPDVGLFPFGEYFVGCLYLSEEIKGIYDYCGNEVLTPSASEQFIVIDDRLYIVSENNTKILDNELNMQGQSNLEVSKRMLQNMYWNIKGVDILYYDNKEKYGLIFVENELEGICDMDLNILCEAEYSNIIYHNNRLFELCDDRHKTISKVLLYEDGTFSMVDY